MLTFTTISAPEGVKAMKKLFSLLVVLGLAASAFAGDDTDNKAADRVKAAATVLEEIRKFFL